MFNPIKRGWKRHQAKVKRANLAFDKAATKGWNLKNPKGRKLAAETKGIYKRNLKGN